MSEKDMYVKLPRGIECREAIVTEREEVQVDLTIPKPNPLMGGTEVYQKKGSPYWYCKIKDGRDEFMHLNTEDLTEEDLYYDSKTGEARNFITEGEQKFENHVLEALANKPKEGFRWIPVFEPSYDGNGGVQFVKGKMPLLGLNCSEWKKIFRDYSAENESGTCSIYTYFLMLLSWLKHGVVTLEQLADDSTEIAHYWDPDKHSHDYELTGQSEFGGLYGFAGNSCKIVENLNSNSGYSVVGVSVIINGNKYPLAEVIEVDCPCHKDNGSVGLLELKK